MMSIFLNFVEEEQEVALCELISLRQLAGFHLSDSLSDPLLTNMEDVFEDSKKKPKLFWSSPLLAPTN